MSVHWESLISRTEISKESRLCNSGRHSVLLHPVSVSVRESNSLQLREQLCIVSPSFLHFPPSAFVLSACNKNSQLVKTREKNRTYVCTARHARCRSSSCRWTIVQFPYSRAIVSWAVLTYKAKVAVRFCVRVAIFSSAIGCPAVIAFPISAYTKYISGFLYTNVG